MYETEANGRVEPADQLPPEVISAFGGVRGKIVARTVLPWSEHHTECNSWDLVGEMTQNVYAQLTGDKHEAFGVNSHSCVQRGGMDR